MVNTARKGQLKEKLARDKLVSEGWTIMFKSVRYRFGCIDYAGIFDLVAYKGCDRKYVSCKHSGSGHGYHKSQIRDHKAKYGYPNESYELWTWHKPQFMGRGKYKIWFPGGFRKEVL